MDSHGLVTVGTTSRVRGRDGVDDGHALPPTERGDLYKILKTAIHEKRNIPATGVRVIDRHAPADKCCQAAAHARVRETL
jgi:hypothetical protein